MSYLAIYLIFTYQNICSTYTTLKAINTYIYSEIRKYR